MGIQGDMSAGVLEGSAAEGRASDHKWRFVRCGAIFSACYRRTDNKGCKRRGQTYRVFWNQSGPHN